MISNGNGAIDRTETYQYFASNDLPGSEHYSNNSGVLKTAGAMQAFQNGTIRSSCPVRSDTIPSR